MGKPRRRKADEKQDPIVELYWLIADLFGHAAAANILSIIASKESE
jgi:hypothetical protein